MKLTQHFSLEELISSEVAMRRGLDNTPGPEQANNLLILATALEQVRSLLGQPIYITSGFRSQEVNRALGSSPQSHHCQGLAADFVCPGFGAPRVVCSAIRDSEIQFNQLIYEGNWTHFSVAEPRYRRSILTARFTKDGVRYMEGIA